MLLSPERFTPTRVGTTRLVRTRRPPASVHPHARGDTFAVARCQVEQDRRFTPTRVGTTRRGSERRAPSPRFTPTRVGTTSLCRLALRDPSGSPPRAWGRWHEAPRFDARAPVHPHAVGTMSSGAYSLRRNSPSVHPHARGDNRLRPRGSSTAVAVHPHARGDNVTERPGSARSYDGSPPRAWGQCVRCGDRTGAELGSPPRAWGHTVGQLCRSGDPVHPHACGESPASFRSLEASVHPHACGDNFVVQKCHAAFSVHPHACGDNVQPAQIAWCGSVHPHACGDNTCELQPIASQHGSPPRLWG